MKSFISILLMSALLSSCLHMAFYKVQLNNGTNRFKKYFGCNKVVVDLDESPYHGGTFWMHFDFSFDRRLVLDLSDSRVIYKGMKIRPYNFFSRGQGDTLSIDGDENLSFNFSLPPGFVDGDSVLVDMKHFARDEAGLEVPIDPFYLTIHSVSKREFRKR